MKNSFARAFLQVLALLTGLAVATVWRDQNNHFVNYPELVSQKAALAPGSSLAVEFLYSPSVLAGNALNLGAAQGHQLVELNREWPRAPDISLRVRSEAGGELEIGFRAPRGGGNTLFLRLSNRASAPSAWLVVDPQGHFVGKLAFPYELPKGHWVDVKIVNNDSKLQPVVGGVVLPSWRAPSGPTHALFRGDSDGGRLRIDDIHLSAEGQEYEQPFAGEMPWLLFLVGTVTASLLFFAVEILTTPRTAATLTGLGFLLLCAILAVSRGAISLPGASTEEAREEARDQALARARGPSISSKPRLLWLGGSQAAGVGTSGEKYTAFAQLRARLASAADVDWVNGAFLGARLSGVKEVFEASGASPVSLVVLITGCVSEPGAHYADDLGKLVAAMKASRARVLLVPEAVDPLLEAKTRGCRAEVGEIARKNGAALAEIETAFESRADEGFHWWSATHLTDAGARIEADALAGPIAGELARVK